jgi:predicted ATPase/DNA-binding SARP family transcriptional activator
MSRLRLKLLGPPRVDLDSEPVHLGRRKALALLAYLALTQRPHSRDALATLFWPNLDQSTSRARLRRVLAVLREGLGDGGIAADREAIALPPDTDLWTDVSEFHRLVRFACEQEHPAALLCSACAARLEEASLIYRGDFLEGFTLRDSPAFDNWQFFEAEGLRDELAGVLERLTRWHTSQRAHEAAISCARRWVALDPLHEPAQRALMQTYSQAGRRAAALRQFEECARTLEAELGLGPSVETVALHERIRSGDLRRRVSPLPLPTKRHNLPKQPVPLVGRERELAEISACLSDPDCRLLTLVGPGGSGKTRLAVEAAARHLDAFEDGVFSVSLAGLQSAASLVPAIAQAIGLSSFSQHDPREQLLAYLSRRQMLLVLDNFEHLLARDNRDDADGTGLVTEISDSARAVSLIVTSRAALRLQGEQLHWVKGLDLPEQRDLDGEADASELTSRYSAIGLFLQSARRVSPDLALEGESLAGVIRICRLVSGMPLGILLAAAWMRVLTPAQIAEQLAEGLDLLETDLRDIPARQRSMRAVFDHSWSLLSAREQAVLAALSIFRGGFTRQAARAIARATLRDLKSLVDRSLVRPVAGARYDIHELLRQYAGERLAASPDPDAPRERHCDFYIAALERWGEELKGPRQREALLEMDLDIDNARAAWDWAVERSYDSRLAAAVFGLTSYFHSRAQHQEAEAVCSAGVESIRAAAAAGTREDADLQHSLARMMHSRATALVWLGRGEVAGDLLEECLDLLRSPALSDRDTRWDRWCAWLAMGSMQKATGSGGYQRSFDHALAVSRSMDDRWPVAVTLRYQGKSHANDEDLAAARRAGEEALAILQDLGDGLSVGGVSQWLGWVYVRQGDTVRGEELVRESLLVLDDLRDRQEYVTAREWLAAVLALCGRYTESHALHEEVLAAWTDLGALSVRFSVVASFPWLELMMGDYGEARQHVEMGLELARQRDSLWVATNCRAHKGVLALLDGDYEGATSLLTEVMDVFPRIACPSFVYVGHCWLSFALRGQGEAEAAQESVVEALRWVRNREDMLVRANVLYASALQMLDLGDTERAVEILALARTYPYLANSRCHDDLVGQPIAKAAASLPPGVVAAARERGRGRDVQATLEELVAEWG